MTGPIYPQRLGGKDYEAFVVKGFFTFQNPFL